VEIGDILERIARGYATGLSFADRRRRRELEERQEAERIEDRNRLLRQLRAGELAQPGASTLADYLTERLRAGAAQPIQLSPQAQPTFRGVPLETLTGSPQQEQRFREEALAGSPITEQSLRRIAQAEQTEVPIEFKRPAPVQVSLPGGRVGTIQDQAPYLMASGDVVMDPAEARRQLSLAKELEDYQRRMAALPTPEEVRARADLERALERARVEGRRPTAAEREEDIRQAEELAKRTGLYEQRTRPPASVIGRPPVSLGALERQIDDTREMLSLLERTTYVPTNPDDPVEQQSYQAALQRIEETRQQLASLMEERDVLVRQLRGQAPPELQPTAQARARGPQVDLQDVFRYTPAGQAFDLARQQEDSAAAGRPIPVREEAYAEIVREKGPEYAAKHYVIIRP